MEAHTPKREAIEKLILRSGEHAPGWSLRVVDQQETPIVRLEATHPHGEPRSLEIHTRQVTLTGDRLDETTQKMIERWLDSLGTKVSHAG